ncbi:NADP-dependent 3-hydroxy acid dehydrogenase YdfG [Bradyrhizobium japonicum]
MNLALPQAIAFITGASARAGRLRRSIDEAWRNLIVITRNIERLMSIANPPADDASRQLPNHESEAISLIEYRRVEKMLRTGAEMSKVKQRDVTAIATPLLSNETDRPGSV